MHASGIAELSVGVLEIGDGFVRATAPECLQEDLSGR